MDRIGTKWNIFLFLSCLSCLSCLFYSNLIPSKISVKPRLLQQIKFFKRCRLHLFVFSLFLLNTFCVSGTEYQPWLGNFYEFEVRSSAKYQGYKRLSSGSNLRKYSSNDVFLNLSLINARPPALGGELEITQARTRKQRGNIDQLKLTGRFVWQDDVAGDPISLTTGLSYAQAFRHGLKDVSSFHHGFSNAELFASIGKESPPNESIWGSRWWSVVAIGVAERGSPWFRLNVDYEKRLFEKHEMRAFLHSLWGIGGQKLRVDDFHGYGPVRHQSIDLGLRYTYLLDYYGSGSLEYSYRVYAYNFPSYAHQVYVQILYTFGL